MIQKKVKSKKLKEHINSFLKKDIYKISITTAFYWRHKILNGLKIDSVPKKLEGNIHINKTIIVENFKGCRNIMITKRSNIGVIAAKGNEDSMLVMPAFKHCWMRGIFY